MSCEDWRFSALMKLDKNIILCHNIVMILMCVRMCGVTKLDKIRNERIRGTKKVGEITQKYRKEG